MDMKVHNTVFTSFLLLISLAFLISCEDPYPDDITVYTNATIWDGIDLAAQENSALIVHQGQVYDIIEMTDSDFPEDGNFVDLENRYIVPGLINAHTHVGVTRGMEWGEEIETRENVVDQLQLYAAYGVTTVLHLGHRHLGGPEAAFDIRNEGIFADNEMARLFLAVGILDPDSPEQARSDVETLMELDPDWTKIRVEDGFGTREKMSPNIYSALIEASHQHNIPLAAHILELEDAKGVVEAGADLLAHSVRDESVDRELIELMLERDACIAPTLTREVSSYIYRDRPDFFDDPFFLSKADPDVIEQLQDPEVQQQYTGEVPDYFRKQLPLVKENMMRLHNFDVRVVLGTDTGRPGRFQGYFAHLEMEMMQEAGMSPAEILRSATRYTAECMEFEESLGTLETGKAADFLVVEEDPLEDIRNLRQLYAVYIGGVNIPDIAN